MSKVNTIVAIQSDAATGALAVSYICFIMNVLEYSQYLLTSTGYRSPHTVRLALNFIYFSWDDELRWQLMPASLFKNMPPNSI